MARRLALLLLALLTLAPAAVRRLVWRPAPARGCAAEGRGAPPREWVGCAADPGTRRALTGREARLAGVPIDLATASAEDLAAVPGLTPRLAAEVVADRERRGPFRSPEDLRRVRGIGPARLARALPHLSLTERGASR
ncbi:MAG TPA: helix-hairpin-helix domain-containing protein [Anaeromyxobacteraceae bacterium]|nr:helix-hairpin-helix domain-containing protein [Anaeromyxobacteraceae bacterium]